MSRAQLDSTGASRGSFKSYASGFVLSLALTAVAFWLVMNGTFPRSAVLFGIVAAGVEQILVHLHYFLHLDTSSEARWNVLAILFALVIMILFVGGSIWIMINLSYRMM
jgi:cytochrome o ubiquinol oxidase operon protein cyoD